QSQVNIDGYRLAFQGYHIILPIVYNFLGENRARKKKRQNI
ncbi:MAG: hypothetical protein RJB31_1397, partial [Bacteroidota bacterium]